MANPQFNNGRRVNRAPVTVGYFFQRCQMISQLAISE